jgi:hypothetical protein
MRIARDGREWVIFTTTSTDAGGVDASFDMGATWVALEEVDDTHARVLVAGDEATGNPAGTVVLSPGTRMMILRLTTASERIVRTAPDHLIMEP